MRRTSFRCSINLPTWKSTALRPRRRSTPFRPRLKTPLVWDYNSMVRGRVDLKKTVKVKAGKTYYRRILDQVLYQAGLKCEVRTDDAGKPLLWITTL